MSLWVHHILMTLFQKFFKTVILQNAGEQPLLKVVYHIIFMINEPHLLWVSNLIALGIYFFFGTKFSWKEETDTCFNVECVLFGRNVNFLGGYFVVTARYIMVTTVYCSLPTSYCSLLVVTARYRSLLFVSAFNMNVFPPVFKENTPQYSSSNNSF